MRHVLGAIDTKVQMQLEMGIWNSEWLGLEISIWVFMVIEGLGVGVTNQAECKEKGRSQLPRIEFWGTSWWVEEKEQVKEAKGNGLRDRKKQNERCPRRRRGRREFHIKDAGQQNVSFPLRFQSE